MDTCDAAVQNVYSSSSGVRFLHIFLSRHSHITVLAVVTSVYFLEASTHKNFSGKLKATTMSSSTCVNNRADLNGFHFKRVNYLAFKAKTCMKVWNLEYPVCVHLQIQKWCALPAALSLLLSVLSARVGEA